MGYLNQIQTALIDYSQKRICAKCFLFIKKKKLKIMNVYVECLINKVVIYIYCHITLKWQV